ncbi:MAG: polysaccharide deacetylase family protein [Bacteroidota bacterium]
MRYFKTPILFKKWQPSLIWHLKSDTSIYLTFDDGPDPEVTPWVLNELKKFNAQATFFFLGKNIDQHLEIGKSVVSAGHQLGNHTYNHMKGWKTDTDAYANDVDACDEALRRIGQESILFRPPYGKINKTQVRNLKTRKIIMWSHSAYDFDADLDIRSSIRNLKKARPGSIVVFHDSQKAWRNLKQILPELLNHYHSRGFKFDPIP